MLILILFAYPSTRNEYITKYHSLSELLSWLSRCDTEMVKQTKSQRLREKVRIEAKDSKQTTLGSLPQAHKTEPSKVVLPEKKKQIEITEVATSTREDELSVKIAFRLVPSRTFFSRLTSDLYFDDQKIDSLHLRILQGPLATDNSEFCSVLDMTGIPEGRHSIRVEMFELWSSDEKLTATCKEVTFDYVPVKREDRLTKVPIMKSVAGADLDIVSETQKNIYREIEEEMKRDSEGRVDHW